MALRHRGRDDVLIENSGMRRDNSAMGGPDRNETMILLAEDEPAVRNLVRTMLCQSGYAVLTANDGAEALAICEAFANEIHLLLTDATMPLMDGLTVAAVVRSKRPGIKVIIMSGNTIETIRAENKPDAFLRKPFIPPTLLDCVQRVLASKGPIDCEH
jgi:two-component system, cell cycle sensor histidine kinase and response regulator CckA